MFLIIFIHGQVYKELKWFTVSYNWHLLIMERELDFPVNFHCKITVEFLQKKNPIGRKALLEELLRGWH